MRRSLFALVLALSLATTTAASVASAATPAGPRPHLSLSNRLVSVGLSRG